MSAIDSILDRSQSAFRSWRHSPAHERAALLREAETRLRARRDEFAKLIVEEAGKPLKLAQGEIDRALGVLDWAAAEALRYAGELLRLDASKTGREGFGINTRFPRGPVLGITPFNFPLNLVLHKIAPAVASGCAIVIKPSPHTPRTARAAASLFEAGPAGLVQVAAVDDASAARMVSDPRIATISFTGSARVGWSIRRQAPEKPTVLELGGNAWLIVAEDLDRSNFAAAAARIAGAAYGYAGQSCISVQNVAVAEAVYDEFAESLRSSTRSFAWGDPALDRMLCGPVIDTNAAARIEGALAAAARELPSEAFTAAGDPEGETTSLAGRLVRPRMVELDLSSSRLPGTASLLAEEIFGPVMTVRPYSDLTEVIEAVNQGRYGLQAGVYTDSLSVAERLYRELEVGGLIVNDVPTTRYDHQPYGGIKQSGLGREGIRYAMDELTVSKFMALSSEIGL